jgi:hypothetical protein
MMPTAAPCEGVNGVGFFFLRGKSENVIGCPLALSIKSDLLTETVSPDIRKGPQYAVRGFQHAGCSRCEQAGRLVH